MKEMVKGLNNLLSFALELCMLAAFAAFGAFVGATLFAKIVLGAAFFIAPLWFWAVYMAPRANKRIGWPWTPVVALLLFLMAAVALLLAHYQGLAMGLAAAAVVNAALTFMLGQERPRV